MKIISTPGGGTATPIGRNADLKRMHGHIPTINGWKMLGLAESADGLAGNIRILQIGNSYNTSPEAQLGQVFGRPYLAGATVTHGVQGLPINVAGVTVSGGAAYAGGASQTLVPQADGYLEIPTGGVVTLNASGTQAWVAYVQEPGAGSLLVEESVNDGSSWTTLTTINANGSLAYQNYKPAAGTRLQRRIRLTASGGTVKVGYLAVLGQTSRITINTGGGTSPDQWNTTNLAAGTIESWWASYDPHLVFISYANDMALHADWATMMSRILASCPNAQIIIAGEHAADTNIVTPSIGADSWDRWSDTGVIPSRNAATQAWCVDHPRVAWIDTGKWLPSLNDTDGNGTLDSAQAGTITPPDYLHLNAFGLTAKNNAIWEAMRPWIFSRTPASRVQPAIREIVDTCGQRITQMLTADITVNASTNMATGGGQNSFNFTGIAKEGCFGIEGLLIVESTSAAGFKSFFDAWNISLMDVTFIGHRGATMSALEVAQSSGGYNFPAATWDAATSTVRIHVRGTYIANGANNGNFDGGLVFSWAQQTATGTTRLKRGSWMSLILPNNGAASTNHRNRLPS